MRRVVAAVGAGAALAIVVGRRPGARRALRRSRLQMRRAVDRRRELVTVSIIRARVGSPRAAVDDDVLAERVRARLGPVVARLDVPHAHVMVEHGVVMLHGDVDTDESAAAVEWAALAVPGVRGVRSHLHVGLLPGDTRPSTGRANHPPSEALHRLLDAAGRGGAGDDDDARALAVSAVLTALSERLPRDERRQFLGHLPCDVRALVVHRPRFRQARRIRHRGEFVAAVAQGDGIPPGMMHGVVNNVLGTLRQLVPEEAADVAAVLPHDLRTLWRTSVPV